MSLRTSLPLKQTHSVAASRKQAVPLPSPRPVWSQESHAPLLSHTQHTHTTHSQATNQSSLYLLPPPNPDRLSVCLSGIPQTPHSAVRGRWAGLYIQSEDFKRNNNWSWWQEIEKGSLSFNMTWSLYRLNIKTCINSTVRLLLVHRKDKSPSFISLVCSTQSTVLAVLI